MGSAEPPASPASMKRPKVAPRSRGGGGGVLQGLFGPKADPEEAGGPVEGEAAAAEPERPVARASAGPLRECPLCLQDQPPSAFAGGPPSPASPSSLGWPGSCCGRRACRSCVGQYLRVAIRESRVPVACPLCPAPLRPADVHRLLPAEDAGEAAALRDKYEAFLLRRLLAADPETRWCPAPDCRYAVFAGDGCAECPRLVCGRPECGTEFCFHCRQPWHPDGPCQQAWLPWELQGTLAAPGEPGPVLIQKEDEKAAAGEGAAQETIKACPRCGALIAKVDDGSCNRMSCAVCGSLFCWLCTREITDVHFLSPSGCTFWGKKPWSRTRKLLWQVGMLLGAPMVISLVAGIAVPVITLGIPIYMGRKVLIHGRKSKLSGCQQCLSVGSSALLSLFVSPVITAVAVGVGVPLMLTYVYGVVVLSLCRSRWACGRGGGGGSTKEATELSTRQPEDHAKPNELLAVLPTLRGSEVGAPSGAGAATLLPPLPARRHSQREEQGQKEGTTPFNSLPAPAGSSLSDALEAAYREGLQVVEVEVEAEPPAAYECSLCSAVSSRSFSTDSSANASDGCNLAGVTTE